MTSAVRQLAQTRDSQTHRHRSTFPRARRCGCDRCSTCGWWCSASTSKCSAIRDRISPRRSGRPKSAQSASPTSLFCARAKCNGCNANGLFSRDSLRMVMRYAHLAPGYLSDEVRKLDTFRLVERSTERAKKGQRADPGDQAGAIVPRFVRENGSSGWTRTNNPPVNSRMLCH